MQQSHSISNISDAIRNHKHRDSFASLGRHFFSPHKTDFPLKNADFKSVSAAVVHLFQKKKLQENELSALQESVRNLATTDAGPLIYDFFKDNLIRKGMVILREKIKFETGHSLLTKLGDQWNYFYREILPVLYSLLLPVETKVYTIQQVSLLEFRNTIVLKLPVKDAVAELSRSDPVYPIIQQMLLVLHGVHENPYTDKYVELEKIVARVTSPYMGILGLYNGDSEPELRSNYTLPQRLPIPVIKISDDATDSEDDMISDNERFSRSPQVNRLLHKRSSGFLQHPHLEAVKELDRGQIRRNSIATT